MCQWLTPFLNASTELLRYIGSEKARELGQLQEREAQADAHAHAQEIAGKIDSKPVPAGDSVLDGLLPPKR